MRLHALVATAIFIGLGSSAWAQGNDPATRNQAGTLMPEGSKSGSGTSSSGGRDANGDAGRDKMPDSDNTVKSAGEQDKKLGGPPGKR